MASEVGSGQVAIFPVFKGFRKAVLGEVDKASTQGGARMSDGLGKSGFKAGRASGRGFRDAFQTQTATTGAGLTKRLTAEAAAASRALSAVRLKEQDSSGKVRVAEAQLTEARKKNVSGSARLIAAEEKLAAAQRAQGSIQDQVKASSDRLAAAQAGLANATVAGNERSTRSVRTFLSASLRRGLNFGASSGADFGGGFLNGFKRALAPLAGIIAGYIGFQALSRGFRAFTGYIRDSIGALGEWQVLNAQSSAVVRSTGKAAGVSAKHIYNLAQATEASTATQAEEIQRGANLVATFKGIRNQAGKNNKIYDQTVVASVNMARALGKDVPSAAMTLSKALNDPAKGLTKLQRSGVTFTQQQQDQVKALVASGKTLEAQKIILKEVNSEFGKSGKAYADTLPGKIYTLKDAFGDLGEYLASGLTPGLGTLAGTFTDILNRIKKSELIKEVVKRISDSFTVFAQKIKAVARLVADVTNPPKKQSGKQIFATLLDGISRIFPKLKPLLGIIGIIGPALVDVFKKVGPAISAALVEIAPSVGDLLKSILPLLPSIVELAKDAIPVLIQVIKLLLPVVKAVVENWSGFFEAIQNITNLLTGNTSVQTFADGVGKLPGLFGLAGQLGKTIGEAITGFIRGIIGFGVTVGDNISKIIGIVTSIPGKVRDAFVGAASWLVNSGKALINGFVKGITDSIGNVGKAMSKLMSFAGSFFPHSPAKRGPLSGSGWRAIRKSGPAISAQFARGVNDGANSRQMSVAMTRLVGVPSATAQSVSRLRAADKMSISAVGTGPTVTQNFTTINPVAKDPATSIREGANYARASLGID